MVRKKARNRGGSGNEWLNNYAGMVTLLLTFFVLMFSVSSVDSAKFNMIVKAFADEGKPSSKIILTGKADGDRQESAVTRDASEGVMAGEQSMQQIYELFESYVQDNGLSQSVVVTNGDNYVFIRFMNDMLFEPGEAVLKQSDREILQFVGYGIKSIQNEAKEISIHVHTAAVPDNSDAEPDRLLSLSRANVILMFFEDTIGIAGEKLVSAGWGKLKPLPGNTNSTGEEQSQNRRVEILISMDNLLTEQLDNVYEKLVE